MLDLEGCVLGNYQREETGGGGVIELELGEGRSKEVRRNLPSPENHRDEKVKESILAWANSFVVSSTAEPWRWKCDQCGVIFRARP